MTKREHRKRRYLQIVSWVLAAAMVINSWPAPALQELLGPTKAWAEEEAVAVDNADSEGEELTAQAPAETPADQTEETKDELLTQDEAANIELEASETELEAQDDYGDIWFEGGDPDPLVVVDANSTAQLTLNTDSITPEATIEWTVGLCVDDEWVPGHVFTKGKEYTISGNTITLKGTEILKHLGGYGDDSDEHSLHVRIFAEAKLSNSTLDNPVISNDTRWIDVVEPYVDYWNDRVWDREMLVGWGSEVYRWYRAWVVDEEHPWGDGADYEVTNVTVKSQTPDDGYRNVVKVEYREWENDGEPDHNWYFEATGHGTATLEVTYRTLEGGTDSYTFDVNVSANVYDVWVWADGSSDNLLPGRSMELYAQGTHHREDEPDTVEGLTYQWKLLEGSEAGTLVVDKNNPQHATFVANSPGPDKMGFNDFVHVRVYLYDGGTEPVEDSGWAFYVMNDFTELWPLSIDSELAPGASTQVTPEVRHYRWGEFDDQGGYETIDNVELWFWYDTNCVSITDAQGNEVIDNGSRAEGTEEVSYPAGTFTITRTGNWNTNISVRASWIVDGSWNECWANWHLDQLNYDLWFEGEHDLDVYTTRNDDDSYSEFGTATNTVCLSDDLANLDGLSIEWTVGTWDNDAYVKTFDRSSGLYTVSADGRSITVNAAKMVDLDAWDLRVIATAKLGNTVLCETGNDFWFHLRERRYEYNLPEESWLLPGWEWYGWIQDEIGVWVQDEDHEGDNLTATVTNVKVADTSVATVEHEDDSWTLRAEGYGDTTVTVTYTDYDGTKGCTVTIPIHVVDDVYEAYVWVSEGDSWALPGGTIKLNADGWHEYLRNGEYGTTTDGLSYEWRIFGDGQDVATITPSADGTSATVTFNERPEGVDRWERDIWVRLILKDNGEQVYETGINLTVCDDYVTITPYPADFNSRLDVGKTITVTPKLLVRSWDQNETDITKDAEFEISFDSSVVRIDGATIDEDGRGHLRFKGSKSLTITRLRNWGTELDVSAWFTNGDGDDDEDNRSWHFERLWHDCDGTLVKVDAKEATPSADGCVEHWKCDTCGKLFEDEDGFSEVAPELVIIPKLIDISKAKVTLSTTSYTYDGSAKKPAVKSVVLDGVTLKAGTDYKETPSYANNTNAATASASKAPTVTITGIGAYAGTAKATFTIAQADIAKASFASIADQSYADGKEVKPTPSVTFNGKTLKSGTDFTLSYKNNKKLGTASVTVTGKGNFKGSKTLNFKIVNPAWSGATKMPVSSTADFTVTGGAYLRVKVNGKWATSDDYVSISSVNDTTKRVTAKKKTGTTTVYLLVNGKQVKSQKVTIFAIHNKKYEFESSVDKNYVLDIQGGSKKDGAQMIVYKRNGGANQKYQFALQSDGTYAIRSVNSKKWLTVDSKSNKYVQQWSWKGTDAQKWRITVDSSNRVTFVNVATNKCFDVQGGKTKNSAKMIVWQYNGGKNQKWKLNQK